MSFIRYKKDVYLQAYNILPLSFFLPIHRVACIIHLNLCGSEKINTEIFLPSEIFVKGEIM